MTKLLTKQFAARILGSPWGALFLFCSSAFATGLNIQRDWIYSSQDSSRFLTLNTRLFQFQSPLTKDWQLELKFQQLQLHTLDSSAGIKDLNASLSQNQVKLIYETKPYRWEFNFAGSPGAYFSTNTGALNLGLGAQSPYQLHLRSTTAADENRQIDYNAFDLAWHLELSPFHLRYKGQHSLYDFSPTPWNWQRTSWQHSVDWEQKWHNWTLQSNNALGLIDLDAYEKKLLWARIDQGKWAYSQSSLKYQVLSFGGAAGFLAARAQVGDDSFIDPFPISPLAALNSLKWRWQNSILQITCPWTQGFWRFKIGAWDTEFSQLLAFPLSFSTQSTFKNRYSTSPPFFSYHTENLEWQNPYLLWQQSGFKISHQSKWGELQLEAKQWLPWFNTDTQSQAKSMAKSFWGGTSLQAQWQMALP